MTKKIAYLLNPNKPELQKPEKPENVKKTNKICLLCQPKKGNNK